MHTTEDLGLYPGDGKTNLLLTPLRLGALILQNRMIMSPMTRMRADQNSVPSSLMTQYYAQRSTAGLIVTEATAARPFGDGYGPTAGLMPGLYNTEQETAWRPIVEAVHDQGGTIAIQLWHVGRLRTEDKTARRPVGWAVSDELRPEHLSVDEISVISTDFAAAARRARSVGFDAVEIHAGSGNLFDRFLRPSTNRRSDGYGDSDSGRIRLLLETIKAVSSVTGNDRVGVKLSPNSSVNSAVDPGGKVAFAYALQRLSTVDLAYLSVNRSTPEDRVRGADNLSLEWMRENYSGNLIAAGAFSREEGEVALADKLVDGVVFGRSFLSNPDLPARFADRAPLNEPNPATFYTPGPEGLSDYPALDLSTKRTGKH